MGISRYESLEANETTLIDVNSPTKMNCKKIAQFTTDKMYGLILNLGANGILIVLVFITASKPLTSYEFQNYKISYAGESEHPLFHENEYFCNIFVERKSSILPEYFTMLSYLSKSISYYL